MIQHGEAESGRTDLHALVSEDEREQRIVDPPAAVLLVDGDAEQPVLAGQPPRRRRDAPARPRGAIRYDFACEKLAHALAEREVLGGQPEVDHLGAGGRWSNRRPRYSDAMRVF